MKERLISLIPDIESDELAFVESLLDELPKEAFDTFVTRYRAKRRKKDTVLLTTVLGFICVAGLQRFYLNQMVMGFLYLFTAGFCLIGTILDTINHADLTLEYNENLAISVMREIKAMK